LQSAFGPHAFQIELNCLNARVIFIGHFQAFQCRNFAKFVQQCTLVGILNLALDKCQPNKPLSFSRAMKGEAGFNLGID